MARRNSNQESQGSDFEATEPQVEVEEAIAVEPSAEIEPSSPPVKEEKPKVQEAKPETAFATSFYQQVGIPHCSVCGESYRTDSYGQPMCPVKKQAPECPRLSSK